MNKLTLFIVPAKIARVAWLLGRFYQGFYRSGIDNIFMVADNKNIPIYILIGTD